MISFVKNLIQRRRDRAMILTPRPTPEPIIAAMPEEYEARLYTVTKKHAMKVERTGSRGEDKHAFVFAAVLAEFRERGWHAPERRDVNLAIEVAVREMR
jgi:hypothetical protein